jgi:hypothetical protein
LIEQIKAELKMKRYIFLSFILIVLLYGCEKESSTGVYNGIPQWLEAKIDSMSTDLFYGGTVVYRYTWHHEYVYHIDIPASSCAYCEVYNQNGIKIQFMTDTELKDFLDNKTDPVVIWVNRH